VSPSITNLGKSITEREHEISKVKRIINNSFMVGYLIIKYSITIPKIGIIHMANI